MNKKKERRREFVTSVCECVYEYVCDNTNMNILIIINDSHTKQ